MTSDFLPRPDSEFCALMIHVRTALPQFYATLGIDGSTPQVAAHATDTTVFAYVCERQSRIVLAGEGTTRERNRARYGDKENPHVAIDLSWPALLTPVPSPVMPGIERRFRDFVKWLRALPGWEESMAVTLHLVGSEITPPDTAELQPTLTLRLNGGKVEIKWTWGEAAGTAKALYIEVDRGPGPTFLVADTNPNYTDTHPLPNTPAKWKYRAIWLRDGQMLGQWSAWVEINVG